MTTTGPDLADALGGKFNHEVQAVELDNGDWIICRFNGKVLLDPPDPDAPLIELGTLSDGRDALVAAYRRLAPS